MLQVVGPLAQSECVSKHNRNYIVIDSQLTTTKKMLRNETGPKRLDIVKYWSNSYCDPMKRLAQQIMLNEASYKKQSMQFPK